MDLETIRKTREKQRLARQKALREAEQARIDKELRSSVDAVTKAVKSSDKVRITNADLAKTEDIESVKDRIDELNLTTFMASQNWLTGLGGIVNSLGELAKDISSIHDAYKVQDKLSTAQKTSLASFDNLAPLITRLEKLAETISTSKVEVNGDLANNVAEAVSSLNATIGKINWNPKIAAPNVQVPKADPLDFSPLMKPLAEVKQSIGELKFPETKIDLTPLQQSMEAVNNTISNLSFPVPNYVLPFKDTGGKGVQAPMPLFDVPYDYMGFTNADANGNYQTWTLKQGGSSGTSVRTFTVAYDGSSNITSITRN